MTKFNQKVDKKVRDCPPGTSIDFRGFGQYQVRIRKTGYPKVTITYSTRELAEEFIRHTLVDMQRGDYIKKKKIEEITLSKVIQRYIDEKSVDKKGEKQEVVRLTKWMQTVLAGRLISSITSDDLEDYINKRRKEKSQRDPSKTVCEGTIRLEMMALSAVFEAAKSKGWNYCRNNPYTDVSKTVKPGSSGKRTRRFKNDEETLLLAELDKACRNHDIPKVVRFAIETAMRQSEIIGKVATSKKPATPGLTWELTDLKHGVAHLPDTKNKKSRDVPLSPAAIEILSALARPIGGGKIFRVTQDGLIRAFADACKRAGIVDLHFHDLRHEATSRMIESNKFNLMEIQSITGHSNAEMVQLYTHFDARKLAQKMAIS